MSKARALVIGEVKAEMARKGLTPTELGRITEKGQQYWSRRTTGSTPFDVDDFALLSEILQVPMSRFVPDVTLGDPRDGGAPTRSGSSSMRGLRYIVEPPVGFEPTTPALHEHHSRLLDLAKERQKRRLTHPRGRSAARRPKGRAA